MAKFVEKRAFISIETLRKVLNTDILTQRKMKNRPAPRNETLAMTECVELSALPRRRRILRKANAETKYEVRTEVEELSDDSMFEKTDSETSEDDFDPSPKKGREGLSKAAVQRSSTRNKRGKIPSKSNNNRFDKDFKVFEKGETANETNERNASFYVVTYGTSRSSELNSPVDKASSGDVISLYELHESGFIGDEELERRLAALTLT